MWRAARSVAVRIAPAGTAMTTRPLRLSESRRVGGHRDRVRERDARQRPAILR